MTERYEFNGILMMNRSDFVQSVLDKNLIYTVLHDLGPREDFYLMKDGVIDHLFTPSRGSEIGGVMFMEFRPAYWVNTANPDLRIRFYRTNYTSKTDLVKPTVKTPCGKCEACECRNPGAASWLE